MNGLILPKGTEVKHGTTLPRAETILQHGFSHGDRDELRARNERAPEQQGLYFGDLACYFGAYTAYSAELVPFWQRPEMQEIYWGFPANAKALNKLLPAAIPIPDTLPVVLVLELGEDCVVYADEDYVFGGQYPAYKIIPDDVLFSEARTTWEKWKVGCIRHPIDPAWVKRIEYPMLTRLATAHRGVSEKTWSDCQLFGGGLMQSALKKEPAPLLEMFEAKSGRRSLSQSVPATQRGIQEIKMSNRYALPEAKAINHLSLTQTVEKVAQHYRIPLHR